jgi:hypothetical protein
MTRSEFAPMIPADFVLPTYYSSIKKGPEQIRKILQLIVAPWWRVRGGFT